MATRPLPQYPDAYGGMTIAEARAQGAGAPRAEAPGPGFFESIRLGFQRGGVQEDWGLNQENWEGRAFHDMAAALRARGHRIPANPNSILGQEIGQDELRWSDPDAPPGLRDRRVAEAAAQFWQAWALESARDPGFGGAYRDVHDYRSFAAHVAQARAQRLEGLDRQAQGGSAVGGFVGQLGHGALDPTSYIPVGGAAARATSIGRAVLGTALREGAANMALTAVLEPAVRADAARIGHDRTATDFLYDEATAGVGGFVLGGALHGAREGAAAIMPLPARVAMDIRREAAALGAGGDDPDVRMLRAWGHPVRAGEWTPDERAAVNVVTRAAQVRQASPFLPGPAGDDEHARWLDGAMAAATSASSAPMLATAPRPIPHSEAAAGTADLSGTRNPAFERVKALIRRSESAGNDNAHNPYPGQTAAGRFQFTNGTWLRLYRRRYGARDSDAAALARKGDGAVQEVLMDDALAGYAARLRRIGAPVDPGNLYLMHALGEGAGEAFLRADPNARAIDVYRSVDPRHADAAYRYNPFLHGTVAETIRWMHAHTGGGEPTPFTAYPEIAGGEALPARAEPAALEPGADPARAAREALGFDDRPILRPDWFATPEEHARAQLRFEAERDAREGFRRVLDDADIPFDPWEHVGRLRAYGEQRGVSLKPEAIAAAIGVSPEELRQVAAALTADRTAPLMVAGDGRIMRRPTPPERPRSLIEFISARGGIEDTTGELKAMDFGRWWEGAPFRRKDTLRARSDQAVRGIAESPEHGPDAHFRAAVEAGYFPEVKIEGDEGEALSHGLETFYAAIDAELRGQPRHAMPDEPEVAARARAEQYDDEDAQIFAALDDAATGSGIALDLATMDDAIARVHAGDSPEVALGAAIRAAAFRDLDAAAAETGDASYAMDAEGRRWDDEINHLGDEAGAAGAADRDAGAGGGRSAADAGDAVAGRPEPQEHQGDPEVGEFDDPVGAGAQRQTESLEHDLRMEVARGDGLGTAGREAYARAHGDLWLKPLDQLDRLFEDAKLSEAAQFGRAIELIGLAPSERLQRMLESVHLNFDRAAALIEKEAAEAGLEIPAAAERIIAPKWDDPPLTSLPMSEDVEKLQQAHAVAADDDAHMVASEVGWALRGIDEERIRAVLDGHGDLDAQAAMATVRLGFERLKELGVPSDKVPAAIAGAMERNGVNPATADELTRSILDALREGGANAAGDRHAQPVALLDRAPPAAPLGAEHRLAVLEAAETFDDPTHDPYHDWLLRSGYALADPDGGFVLTGAGKAEIDRLQDLIDAEARGEIGAVELERAAAVGEDREPGPAAPIDRAAIVDRLKRLDTLLDRIDLHPDLSAEHVNEEMNRLIDILDEAERDADLEPDVTDMEPSENREGDYQGPVVIREGVVQPPSPYERFRAAARERQAYQLDEEGGPVSLREILDEADAEARAAAEMRACMAPPKGGGE